MLKKVLAIGEDCKTEITVKEAMTILGVSNVVAIISNNHSTTVSLDLVKSAELGYNFIKFVFKK